jgi:ferritin-like metal-binding protein YciE
MDELFHSFLQDVYYAEKQLLKALPKLAKKSTNINLQEAFATHRDETEEHVARLEKVFEIIGKRPRGNCRASREHYEIARYGTLRQWAKLLGQEEAADLLDKTLVEEKHADELLTSIAVGGLNESANERPQAAE